MQSHNPQCFCFLFDGDITPFEDHSLWHENMFGTVNLKQFLTNKRKQINKYIKSNIIHYILLSGNNGNLGLRRV